MNIVFIFVGFVFKWGVDYNLFFPFHFLNKDPFCLDTKWLSLLCVFPVMLHYLGVIRDKFSQWCRSLHTMLVEKLCYCAI